VPHDPRRRRITSTRTSVARVRDLSDAALAFLAERHLATLTSLRADGSPHVTPVGFTYDAEADLVRVICDGASLKARLARAGRPTAVCQVDGARWLTLQGRAQVSTDPQRVADAERRYTARYRPPRMNPNRVVIEIAVDRVYGSRRVE
jgi:F420H(2)-dependent biliverdin reductase